MSEVTLAKALSADESWKILDLLMKGEMPEREISKSLRIPLKVTKSHLKKLIESGLVGVHNSETKRSNVYYLTGKTKSVGYPPRGYERLSEELMSNLVKSMGQDGARMILRDIGVRTGEDIAKGLISMAESSKVSPEQYADLFVNRLLKDSGTYPKLRSVKDGELVYEQSNCLFQELADKLPGLVCDTMDLAVHEGMDNILGVKTSRYACKGHGDPSCVYCVSWDKVAK